MIDLRQLLIDGHGAMREARAEQETDKAGTLRIGNAGIVAADGQVYGTCHRITLARLLGYQKQPDMSQRIMFLAGERNEDSWVDVLTAAGWEVDRKFEVKAANKYGREILGHPDIILKQDGKPVMGLELKGIYGTSTLENVLKGRPKNDNLIQAAAYSFYSGLPYALCYTLPSWSKAGGKQVKPLYRIFYLEWRDGVLWYRDEMSIAWYKTVITQDSIAVYWDRIDEMIEAKTLHTRPNANYVDGGRNKWGPDAGCNFCKYQSACARYDVTQDYDKWTDDASNATEDDNE